MHICYNYVEKDVRDSKKQKNGCCSMQQHMRSTMAVLQHMQ